MEKEIKVTCSCGTILIIDRISGKVLATRKPLVKDSGGDRFADAFQKVSEDKTRRHSVFDNMKENQEKKKKVAEELFNASLEDAKKSGDDKPHNVFDLD